MLGVREMELTRRMSLAKPPAWVAANLLMSEWEACEDDQQAAQLRDKLRVLLKEGANAFHAYEGAWAEIREVMQEKAKLALAEHRRTEAQGGYVRLNDMMTVILGLLAVVKETVHDHVALKVIQTRFNSILAARRQAAKSVPYQINGLAESPPASNNK
jgi:hypothetical protein